MCWKHHLFFDNPCHSGPVVSFANTLFAINIWKPEKIYVYTQEQKQYIRIHFRGKKNIMSILRTNIWKKIQSATTNHYITMDNSAVQSEFIFYVDISVLICFFYAGQTYLYDNLISLIISNKEYIKYWTQRVYKHILCFTITRQRVNHLNKPTKKKLLNRTKCKRPNQFSLNKTWYVQNFQYPRDFYAWFLFFMIATAIHINMLLNITQHISVKLYFLLIILFLIGI